MGWSKHGQAWRTTCPLHPNVQSAAVSATWALAQACIRDMLAYVASQKCVPGQLPLSSIKRLIKLWYGLELNEKSLGYPKLSDLLKDPGYASICQLRWEGSTCIVVQCTLPEPEELRVPATGHTFAIQDEQLPQALESTPMLSDGSLLPEAEVIVEASRSATELLEMKMQVTEEELRELLRVKEVLLKEATCPITHELMRQPVLGPDGFCYERRVVTLWLRRNPTSPTTRESMRASQLLPNGALEKLLKILHPEEIGDGGTDVEESDSEDGLGTEAAPPVQTVLGLLLKQMLSGWQCARELRPSCLASAGTGRKQLQRPRPVKMETTAKVAQFHQVSALTSVAES